MGLHIARGMTATFNLILGGLLTYLWVSLAQQGEGIGPLRGIGEWMLISAMIAMTVAATTAAAHLLLRRTVEQGLKWNQAVSFCWLFAAAGGIVASLRENTFARGEVEAVAFLGGMGVLWLLFGWAIRQFMNVEVRKAAVCGSLPVTTLVNDAAVLALAASRETRELASTSAPVQNHEPLVLGRRC